MDPDQLLNHLGGAFARDAAFGGDSELGHVLAGRGDAPVRCFGSVHVHQAEIDFRAGIELQVAERLEIGVVVPVDGHRHVKVGQRVIGGRGDCVGQADHGRRVDRLDEVLGVVVAITQVNAHLHPGRNRIAQLRKRRGNNPFLVFHGRHDAGLAVPGHCLDAHIPLDGQIGLRE